jgi:hypothetical protein
MELTGIVNNHEGQTASDVKLQLEILQRLFLRHHFFCSFHLCTVSNLLLQQRKLLLWIMITTKEFYDAWKQFVLATKIVSAWNMNHGGPSNVQVVDDFLEEPS